MTVRFVYHRKQIILYRLYHCYISIKWSDIKILEFQYQLLTHKLFHISNVTAKNASCLKVASCLSPIPFPGRMIRNMLVWSVSLSVPYFSLANNVCPTQDQLSCLFFGFPWSFPVTLLILTLWKGSRLAHVTLQTYLVPYTKLAMTTNAALNKVMFVSILH